MMHRTRNTREVYAWIPPAAIAADDIGCRLAAMAKSGDDASPDPAARLLGPPEYLLQPVDLCGDRRTATESAV